MTNLNDIIEQAAQQQKVAAPGWMSHEEKAGFHVAYPKGFVAGASFATTDPLILQGLLQPFAEWVSREDIFQTLDGKWIKDYGAYETFAENTEELIAKYIHLQTTQPKEDARQ